MARRSIIALLLVFTLGNEALAAGHTIADFSGPPGPTGVPAPWRLKVNAGHAGISLIQSPEGPTVRLRSEDASFALERDFALSSERIGMVRWRWRAEVLPEKGDVRSADRNDQALQVMFAFEGRHVISYVWDTTAPVGTVRDESLPWPLSLRVKVIVVASGESARGKWVAVQRDLADDYRKLFGAEVPALCGIRLQTNSQHTGTLGVGVFGPISFPSGQRMIGRGESVHKD